jgi:hypothetical protein
MSKRKMKQCECGAAILLTSAACKSCASAASSKRRAMARRDVKLPPSVRGARWIALGQKRFALVSACDYERVRTIPWRIHSSVQYAFANDEGRRILLHRVVMGEPDAIVDHRRRDYALDCRRSNLRVASRSESSRNGRKRMVGRTASEFKGVVRHRDKWSAQVWANGKKYYLGTFDTDREAALAYDVGARERHGPFACVNFPRRGEVGALRDASENGSRHRFAHVLPRILPPGYR